MQEVHADKVLMLAIGNNDYISYNKLFDRYYGRLCQYVYSLLMDRNDAEDVVQELFLNLWKNRGRIEIKENVSGYLYRMAKHLALNFIRSRCRREVYQRSKTYYFYPMRIINWKQKSLGSLFMIV